MKIDFSLAQLEALEKMLAPLPAYMGSDATPRGEAYDKICDAVDSVKSRVASLEASIKLHEQDIASLKAELAAL